MTRRELLLGIGTLLTVSAFAEQNQKTATYSELCSLVNNKLYQDNGMADLPPAMRTSNWGGGSCVHASTYHLLMWQGYPDLAKWWKETYSGGEYSTRLHERLEAANLKYAYTVDGDVSFLDWALSTRRGAGITYWPNHAVNLVSFDTDTAGILDNNRKDNIINVPRNEFVPNWQGYGGWAWTLVYVPPPPLPFV